MTDQDNTPPADNEILYKLLHVYLPVLGLAVGFAAVYSALNWLLVARSGLLPLDEDMVGLWLPGGLGLLLAFFVVNPRLRVLDLSARSSTPLLYLAAAAAVIAVPAMVAQAYIARASGELTHVTAASQIASAPDTKFYATDGLCLARGGAQAQPVFSLGGHNDDTLDFTLYVTVPVCDGEAQDLPSTKVWLGMVFHDSISNSVSDADKDAAYKAFAQRTENTINADDPARYRFLERAGPGPARRSFEKALRNGHVDPTGAIFLLPHTETFAERTGDTLPWTAGAFAIAAIAWLIMVMWPALDYERLRDPVPAAPTPSALGTAYSPNILLPRPSFYGLPLLIDVNVGVFLAMALSGLGVMAFQTDDLMAWGAAYGPAIHGLGVLRLISVQFVHGGLLHLAGNMYGLVVIGLFLDPVLRNARLILCYLLCGLGGAIASVTVHPDTVSVGASGAIFGLAAILLVLLVLGDKRVAVIRQYALVNIGIFVVYNLVIGATSSGIDNAAHIGGLVTGTVLGGVLFLVDRAGRSET